MRYFGGKMRISKNIVEYLKQFQMSYWEPMIGAGWVMSRMPYKYLRLASDANRYLVSMWKALQMGWEPPGNISEKEYAQIRDNKDNFPPELVAFVGFACSWGGKWFGGYARSGDRNYATNGRNSLLKKIKTMSDVCFFDCDFLTHPTYPFNDWLIYCDPPYKGTVDGYGVKESFNHDLFWDQVRVYSERNVVIVSEYEAPGDFECVLEIRTKTDVRNKDGEKDKRVEKLWRYRV